MPRKNKQTGEGNCSRSEKGNRSKENTNEGGPGNEKSGKNKTMKRITG